MNKSKNTVPAIPYLFGMHLEEMKRRYERGIQLIQRHKNKEIQYKGSLKWLKRRTKSLKKYIKTLEKFAEAEHIDMNNKKVNSLIQKNCSWK